MGGDQEKNEGQEEKESDKEKDGLAENRRVMRSKEKEEE